MYGGSGQTSIVRGHNMLGGSCDFIPKTKLRNKVAVVLSSCWLRITPICGTYDLTD